MYEARKYTSGISVMAAAMKGAINVSIPDGWLTEFVQHNKYCFVINPSDTSLPNHIQDENDSNTLYNLLEKEILRL